MCALGFEDCPHGVTQPKPPVGVLPACKPTHQGSEKVFKSYACNYKEQ